MAEALGAFLFQGDPTGIERADAPMAGAGSPIARPTSSQAGHTERRRCPSLRLDGRPCQATPQRERSLCTFHDPERRAQGVEARRLGGLHRRRLYPMGPAIEFAGLQTADGIRSILERAVTDVLNLEPSIARSRVMIAAASAALRLLETTDHEQRLARLEAVASYSHASSQAPAPPAGDSDLPELDE